MECKFVSKPNQSTCDICNDNKYLSTDEISNHVRSFHIGKDLKCIICKLVIKVEFLERHAKTCIAYSYKLTISEKKYVLSVVRLRTTFVIQCTICDIAFSTTNQLVNHLKSNHKSVIWFCCSICDTEVPFHGVAEHTSIHTLLGNYGKWITYHCLSSRRKVIFKDWKSSYVLVKTTVGFTLKICEVRECYLGETAECKICTMIFDNLEKLEDHIKIIHNLGYKCTLCNKVIGYTHIVLHVHFDVSGSAIDCIECFPIKKNYSFKIQKAQHVVKCCPEILKDQNCIMIQQLQKSVSNFFCCICKLNLNSLKNFYDHFSSFHKSINAKLCCIKCKMMVFRTQIYEHFQSHHINDFQISFIDLVQEFEGIPKSANKGKFWFYLNCMLSWYFFCL